ncbi:unnamed protein product, partial [Scytosiphon promiscuus]
MLIYPIVDGAYAIAAKVENNKRVWKPHTLLAWKRSPYQIRTTTLAPTCAPYFVPIFVLRVVWTGKDSGTTLGIFFAAGTCFSFAAVYYWQCALEMA